MNGMTKNEYIALRIEELEARRTYAAQLVMNRDMAHEVKICDLQITALMAERDLVVINDGAIQLAPAETFDEIDMRDGKQGEVYLTDQDYTPVRLMHNRDGQTVTLCHNHVLTTHARCVNCNPHK